MSHSAQSDMLMKKGRGGGADFIRSSLAEILSITMLPTLRFLCHALSNRCHHASLMDQSSTFGFCTALPSTLFDNLLYIAAPNLTL
ncbi:hypothetical protein KP509_1Z139300 [Ceratopteris richardii]|nr:hypothetical protein KP509_1Z139300 [Ceratopteris richardii]